VHSVYVWQHLRNIRDRLKSQELATYFCIRIYLLSLYNHHWF
jgi:hypothetical protein